MGHLGKGRMVLVDITARAISYSFRDLSLLDIAYISCDIKE